MTTTHGRGGRTKLNTQASDGQAATISALSRVSTDGERAHLRTAAAGPAKYSAPDFGGRTVDDVAA
jgi:hypothetical protein